jgi:hypothetical protein
MRLSRRRAGFAVVGCFCLAAVVMVASGAARNSDGPSLTGVPSANTKSPGYAPPNVLSPELGEIVAAQGSTKLENTSALTSYYGYDNDVLNAAGQPQMVPAPPNATTEATKTEPDKNVYLVFKHGLAGADPNYYYGTHFLFQGHEGGADDKSGITRINLDADAAHRVTLLATADTDGADLDTIDGVTWDPWAKLLLFTTEDSGGPSVYSATPGYPSTVEDLAGSFGHGAYEGIQNDSDGNLWIAEDSSGAFKGATKAKIPNSFVYRFIPEKPGDLKNGKLQVLQVLNGGAPITRASQTPLNSPDQLALHTYGSSFDTKWITIHDTAVDGATPFDANALATTKDGTPFKRPENGVFRPGSKFREFYFDETGDTDATSPENDDAGGWTSVFKLTQKDGPSADSGKITIFYKGDQAHAGFDNVAFLSKGKITFVEDAGDGLHAARNALDSGYVLDVDADYSKPANQPTRWLAEGRDPSATLDSANGGFGVNEGDNEITGVHVSDGDASPTGILGAKVPKLFRFGWRWFYTQQHGDNVTWEVVPAPGSSHR